MMNNMIKKLKEKWGLESGFQLVIIILVFAVNGSLAVAVAKPLLSVLNVDKNTVGPWFYYPIRILVIFPIYQITLLIIGSLFGQFRFFWAFEKKIFSRFKRRESHKDSAVFTED